MATGLYTYDALPFQYEMRGPGRILDVPEPMVTDFTRDLTDGIADTGVRAAFLKCAVEAAGLTPGVERTLRAVGVTSRETGTPITVHTSSPAQVGRLALRVLQEEGVDLSTVVVGHAGDSNDLDYLQELADTGAILGMDRFGLDLFNPTASRVDTIVSLCDRGYADRMVLSHDASCYIDWFGPDPDGMKAAMTPNWHYNHISDDVLPMLRERGVPDAQITAMLVDNPKRYFS